MYLGQINIYYLTTEHKTKYLYKISTRPIMRLQKINHELLITYVYYTYPSFDAFWNCEELGSLLNKSLKIFVTTIK